MTVEKKETNKKKTTMSDVARLANVSQATVSYVINNSARISPEVVKRVNEAIQRLGYTPNAMAQNLKKQYSKTIGLLLPTVGNPFYAEIANGAEEILRKNGYISILACTNGQTSAENVCINEFISYNVAGIVVGYSLADKSILGRLTEMGIPLIVIDDRPEKPEVSSVEVDNDYGGYIATRHLIEIGCRRIAIVSEPLKKLPLVQRVTGWERAIGESKSDGQLMLIPSGPESGEVLFENGYGIARSLLERGYDGIFATSDYLALGILRYMIEEKVNIPEKVALIGYDGIYSTRMSTPSLSTIVQPIREMVDIGISMLLSQIAGERLKTNRSLLPILEVRASTETQPQQR